MHHCPITCQAEKDQLLKDLDRAEVYSRMHQDDAAAHYSHVQRLQTEQARLGALLVALASRLGVEASWGPSPGLEEEVLLRAADELKALAGPDARVRLAEVLGQVREARDYMLLGSAPKAKEAMAEACMNLLAMAEGRA